MIEIYSCGREDIATGQIDRRVMAMLEYLATRGFRLTITSLKCGHSIMTTSGNVSAHSTGDAVDIAQVNGIPILGNQGRGSITEAVIQELLKLQGTMAPAQIISLMEMGGPTFAMGDHADHIHVGYTPDGSDSDAQPLSARCSARPVGQAARPDRRARRADGADEALRSTRCPPRRSGPAAPTSASSGAAEGLALAPLLPFAQLDLPGRLGPGDGRYLLRPEGEPDAEPDVLVAAHPRRPAARRRRACAAAGPRRRERPRARRRCR